MEGKAVKKFLIVLLVLALLIGGAAAALKYWPAPKSLGASERFSEAQIAQAAKIAEKYVKDFDGVLRILKIHYKEAKADAFCETDFESGRFDKANTITFFVDFATGAHTTSLNIWDVYTDYAVIITRPNENAPFDTVADSGY